MGKTGSQVFERRETNVFGEKVEAFVLEDGTLAISKRDAQHAIGRKLKIGDRQQRGSVSSYCAESLALPSYQGGLNDPLFTITSFVSRVLDQVDRRDDARVENGRKGGDLANSMQRPVQAPAASQMVVFANDSGKGDKSR